MFVVFVLECVETFENPKKSYNEREKSDFLFVKKCFENREKVCFRL